MRKFIPLFFFVVSLAAQNTPKFPGALPTAADLGIASNRAETTLATGINSTATSIPVASSSGFKAGSFATIDNEVLKVCSIPNGTHLNVGVSACPNVDGRGVDTANGGGAAAAHLANAKVQGRIVAWHQNQMAAELVAIATAVRDVRSFGAKGDGSTIDTAAIQAGIDAMSGGGILIFPSSSGCYKSGNLTITNATNLTLHGTGGRICWTGTAAPGNSIGLQYVGTLTNLRIEGLILEGDGVIANSHAGIWGFSGQTLTNFHFDRNSITNVTVGISVNADLSGAILGGTVAGNYLNAIVGEDVGHGYAIHHANGSGNPSALAITDNTIVAAGRHSIYQARGSGVTIANNHIYNHRVGSSAPGSERSAIVVARSTGVAVTGNTLISPKDGAIEIYPCANCVNSPASMDVTVAGNVVQDPSGCCAPFGVGALTPSSAAEGVLQNVTFIGNTIRNNTGVSTTLVSLYSGKHIKFVGNNFEVMGGSGGPLVYIWGQGESGASATYTDDIGFHNNVFNTNGQSATIIQFSAVASVSTASFTFTGNTMATTGSAFYFEAAQTNPNIRYWDNPTGGLDLTLSPTLASPPLIITGGDVTLSGGGSGNERRFQARFNSTASNAGNYTFHGLQLGNNGSNFVVAGNTSAGGFLNFVVNNSNPLGGTTSFDSYNGILAGRINAAGNWNLFGNLEVSGETKLDGNLILNGGSGLAFASLPVGPNNGTVVFCNNCTIASPCASGGAGAIAKRLGGIWVCN